MAEFGAHLATNLAPNRPSIFEVLAQENLSSGLRSAFLYLSNILAESNPNRYLVLRSWFDEIYLAFDVIVQSSHLKAYNASFAEKFYGLQRVPLNGSNLTSNHFLKSLVFLSAYPYIKRKLDLLYSSLKRTEAERGLDTNSKAYYFVKAYPLLCLVYETTNLIYQIRYAVGNASHHSLLVRLASVQLQNFVKDSDTSLSEQWVGWVFAKWVARGLGLGLSFGAFFIQFLDFFYTREDTPVSISSLPIPPPPKRNQINSKTAGLCLLCNEKRRNDTALSTSGYVFCYACIRGFIARNHKCPITGLPASLSHLIRLYPPGN